ncbi:MAG: flavodoxin [Clostridium sp.]|nr:flavodoxin [Clostridium sp.]
MKKTMIFAAAALGLFLTGCSAAQGTQAQDTNHVSAQAEKNILIAYFTRLDNTDASLEEVLAGGGPYGPIGSLDENADLDAVSSASIQLIDGEVQGSTEAVARMIQEQTGGELFSIRTVQDYPVDYDALIDQGGEEKNGNIRPELSSQVENMDDYDVVFLGFPNWWYDMPMGVYSFLEAYDFSGKTVIPFVTSAGSGFSGSIKTLSDKLPGADVVTDGLAVSMGEVFGAENDVKNWIEELGLQK